MPKRTAKATGSGDGSDPRGVAREDQETGRRIRIMRVDAKISQMQLGELLGVTFQQIQKYEKGMNRVTTGRLMQIAEALNTTPHELMGWKSKTNVSAIDLETHKLAMSFKRLPDVYKRPVRSLIDTLIAEHGEH